MHGKLDTLLGKPYENINFPYKIPDICAQVHAVNVAGLSCTLCKADQIKYAFAAIDFKTVTYISLLCFGSTLF